MGLTLFTATSGGTTVEPLWVVEQQHRRLKHSQRSVSGRKNGSAIRIKVVSKLGNL